MKNLFFTLVFATGIGVAIYIYFFDFDNHSETELVKLSFLWALPIVFGLSGMLTEKSAPEQALVQARKTSAVAALVQAGVLKYFFG